MEISSNIASDEYLCLNTCGIQITNGKECRAFRPDGRRDYHILYLTSGCCIVERGGKPTEIDSYNMILFRPGEPQFYKFPKNENIVSLFLHFSGKGCDEILEQCGLDKPVTHIGQNDKLERIFSKLVSEHVLKNPLCEKVCTGLLIQYLAYAGRMAAAGNQGYYPENAIEKICCQMRHDIIMNLPVSHYAKQCCLSESRFSHAFKEQTGLSPKQYMIKAKVETACSLLEYQGYSIPDAARAVGIEDLNYFSRLIRAHTNHTPGWFRKQY